MTTLSEPKPKKTRKQLMEEAFQKATLGIAADLPTLMYGSGGGVGPLDSVTNGNANSIDSTNEDDTASALALASSDTRQLVAALTAQYIQRLVDAALDARDMFLSGDKSGHSRYDDRNRLPPPPLESLYRPRSTNTKQQNDASSPGGILTARKRRLEVVSSGNWDDPLPTPKIRGRTDPATGSNPDHVDDKEDWVGVVGVDLWHNSRARSVYVQGLTAQQFIFPLCHDAYVYGRIREVQATKVSVLEPVLHDSTIWDTVRAEGQLQHEEAVRKRRQLRHNKKKSNKPTKQRKTSDDEDEGDGDESNQSDTEDEEQVSGWPGLEKLLPANRNFMV